MTWTGLGYLVPYSLMATIILSWSIRLDRWVGVNNTPIEIAAAAFLILILKILRRNDRFMSLKLECWGLILFTATAISFFKMHHNL